MTAPEVDACELVVPGVGIRALAAGRVPVVLVRVGIESSLQYAGSFVLEGFDVDSDMKMQMPDINPPKTAELCVSSYKPVANAVDRDS